MSTTLITRLNFFGHLWQGWVRMDLFTKLMLGGTVDTMPEEPWFTFQDVIKWYVLTFIPENMRTHTKMAVLFGMAIPQVGRTIRCRTTKDKEGNPKGEEHQFSFRHLDTYVNQNGAFGSRSLLLETLRYIAQEMEKSNITREMLDGKIAASSRPGRKAKVPLGEAEAYQVLSKTEWGPSQHMPPAKASRLTKKKSPPTELRRPKKRR